MKIGVNMEKRTFERHFQKASIVCACFNTNKYCPAKMLNYGEGGLYFESGFPFKPRTCIYIRVEKILPIASGYPLHHGLRSSTIGEVKWCQEISDSESYKYGIGVKYYEPY